MSLSLPEASWTRTVSFSSTYASRALANAMCESLGDLVDSLTNAHLLEEREEMAYEIRSPNPFNISGITTCDSSGTGS